MLIWEKVNKKVAGYPLMGTRFSCIIGVNMKGATKMKLFKFLNHTGVKSYNGDKGARVLYKSIVRTVMANFDNSRKKANTLTNVYSYLPAYSDFDSDVVHLDSGKINLGLEDSVPCANIISDGKYFLLMYRSVYDNPVVLCDGFSNVLLHTTIEELNKDNTATTYELTAIFEETIKEYKKSVDNNH